MFLNSGFNIVKKAGLLVFLLLPSLLVQAQVSDSAVTTVSDTAASGDAATNADTSDAAVTTVESQVAEAAEISASEGQPSEDQQRRFSFPRWPESRMISRERLPLAPPGPYMSSALSDYSFKEPSFDRVGSRRAINMDSSDMPVERFSPDIPWPSHAKSPARWQPENGYRYVEPRDMSKPYQMPYNAPSNYNYGYKRNPAMSWPDSRMGYSKPVMNNPAH